MNRKPVIKATNLKKTYGPATIFENLDVDVYEGDFTVIMGPSGAGKSTLMYSLSGMDKPDSGSILIDGVDITRLDSDKLAKFRRKGCGFVFQQIHLIDSMSLMDNVVTAGILTNPNKEEVRANARKRFEQVGIDEAAMKKTPTRISGGQAQRAGIVRAIINEPRILFADEPTGALNSAAGTAVLEVFTRLNNDGQTIVMVTHDKKSALRGNRILYIKDGRIFGQCELGPYSENDSARTMRFEQFLTDMEW